MAPYHTVVGNTALCITANLAANVSVGSKDETARAVGRWGRRRAYTGSAQGRPVLKMRGYEPHSRQEHPHDRRGNEPVAPAHDRRHDDPKTIAEDPARLHPLDQELRCIPWPIARQGELRRCTALSAASGCERCRHTNSQS